MKQRILPGAAGLIALTATIGFIDGHREMEVDSYSRNKITLIYDHSDRLVNSTLANYQFDKKSENPAYLVEIMRGEKIAEIKVDAVTGRVLSS
jgi:hypothetical protein